MKLMQSQFELELDNSVERKFNLIVLGMSGSGKTHWSKLLAQRYGYPRIEFDDLISTSAELAELVRDIPGRDAAEKMGNYFGRPWSQGYPAKEAAYLDIEKKFMSQSWPTGSIFDLTGSCVYHAGEMRAISATGLVIYLETSLEKEREMLEIFKEHPKPVCWDGIFERRKDETNEQALERCYPLLAHRANLYSRFADVILPYAVHKNMQSVDGLVQEVKKQLPRHS